MGSQTQTNTPFEYVQMEFDLVIPEIEIRNSFSEEEILGIRKGMLAKGMQAILDFRASRETRLEWWEWVMSNDIAPFSFVVCALESDVNPVELRSSFVNMVQRKYKTSSYSELTKQAK